MRSPVTSLHNPLSSFTFDTPPLSFPLVGTRCVFFHQLCAIFANKFWKHIYIYILFLFTITSNDIKFNIQLLEKSKKVLGDLSSFVEKFSSICGRERVKGKLLWEEGGKYKCV